MIQTTRLPRVNRAVGDRSIVRRCRLPNVVRSTLYPRDGGQRERSVDDATVQRAPPDAPIPPVACDGGDATPGAPDSEPKWTPKSRPKRFRLISAEHPLYKEQIKN
jgi:hypothetical protein